MFLIFTWQSSSTNKQLFFSCVSRFSNILFLFSRSVLPNQLVFFMWSVINLTINIRKNTLREHAMRVIFTSLGNKQDKIIYHHTTVDYRLYEYGYFHINVVQNDQTRLNSIHFLLVLNKLGFSSLIWLLILFTFHYLHVLSVGDMYLASSNTMSMIIYIIIPIVKLACQLLAHGKTT